MKYNHLIIIAIFAAVLMQGCDLEQDVAPMPSFIGESNTTIAELLAMHKIGSVDSYDSIPVGSNVVITGVVTTSDEWGNNYKYINIEDETGAIQIKINNTALYNKYKVGQRVYVKCDGLVIGDYRKLPQLGMWANGQMQPIPSFKAYLYIFPDGAPMAGENPIVMTTIPNANDIPETQYNRLVRLEGATFVEGGDATFSEASAATSRDIKMADGSTIVLRTSNYATFANEILPEGTGNITGILTRYNNTVQIVINGTHNLESFTMPLSYQTIFSVNYGNAFNEGWFQTGDGNPWQALTNSSFNGFVNNPAAGQDNWLVSPAINLSAAGDPILSFTHRAPQGFNGDYMKVFYTTDYTGDVNTTQWHQLPLNINNGEASSVDELFNLPDEARVPGFRMLFRMTGNPSSWYLSNIKIEALAK